MTLKVYADRMSQPSRAVLIFCKINGIDFEEIRIDVLRRDQFTPEYKAINPMSQVPAIIDGRFKLFESHAILIYLASAFPGVADHWYPADLFKRAKIHSVLDWHHTNLRRGAGSSQPSIADLSLVCELMQLELLNEDHFHQILSPYKKVLQWMDSTKSWTQPHFDEIHVILFKVQKKIRERNATQSIGAKNDLHSKM